MIKKYKVDYEKIRKGIEEMLKSRINEILDCGGPLTFASAIDNYAKIRKIADLYGINTIEYDNKFSKFKEELGIK